MGEPYTQVKLNRTKFLDRIVISLRIHIAQEGYEALGRKKARSWRATYWRLSLGGFLGGLLRWWRREMFLHMLVTGRRSKHQGK